MLDLKWLDVLPATARTGLLASSAGLAVVGTSPLAEELWVAVGIALGVLAAWVGVYVAVARPALRDAAEARLDQSAASARDRGILVQRVMKAHGGGSDMHRILQGDPAFSVPVLLELATQELEDGLTAGPGQIVAARQGDDRVELEVVVRVHGAGAPARRITLSRPVGATSPPPGAEASGWTANVVEHPAPPPTEAAIDPGLPAARRALLARAEAFDLEGFEALVAEIDAALDRDGGGEAYCTPLGAACLQWWAQAGQPPGGGPTTWLEVEEDGWFERIEVRRGQRILGLLRPSGEPAAPWRLWRLRKAA